MDKPVEELRILILEDIPSDAELEEMELRDAELVPTVLRVDTRRAFEQALDEFKPDIILADYKLPAYSGRDALEYAHRTHPEVPVIMVTGALGDEAAVELLKLGAMDYVLKDHLVRLAPAIRRAMSEERDIHERKIVESKYRALFTEAMDGIVLIDCSGQVGDCNPAFERICSRKLDELKTMNIGDLSSLEKLPAARETLLEIKATGCCDSSELEFKKPDGAIVPVDISAKLIRLQGEEFIQVIVRDISERKRAEVALRRANRALRTLSAGNLALVRAASEDELLRAVTRVIVEEGGYRVAEVNYAGDDPEKSMTLMAWAGSEEGCYWTQQLSWADRELGQLPVSKAIRNGTPQICRDIARDPAFKPWKDAALARGYLSNIAMPLAGGGSIFGGLSIYASEEDAFDEEEVQLLMELANDLAYGIVTLRTRVEHEQQAAILRRSLEQSIQAIAATVEARDPYTAGHQRRVGVLATAIAREMGLPEEQIQGIHFAAIIHDLGKIRIPAEILVKPGQLSHNEYQLIKEHPQAGCDILKNVRFPWPIADIVLQHHEKLDGSGYPQGLKAGQILLEARILTVADVVEAISSHRPYRPGLGIDTALKEIEHNRGLGYDADVVDVCIRLFRELGYQLPG